MSQLDEPKSLLDVALESLDSQWDTCSLSVTCSGLVDSDRLAILGTQLGVGVVDTGSQLIFTRFGRLLGFNRSLFEEMLRHYFEQVPDMVVEFR